MHVDHWGWRWHYTHECSRRVRARWRDRRTGMCGRKAGPGSGPASGHLQRAPAVRHHAGQRELSPSSSAGARAGPRLQTPRSPYVKLTFCSSTHWSYRMQKCTEKSNGSVLSAFQPDFRAEPGILGHYIIITCFSSLLPSLLLISTSLLH